MKILTFRHVPKLLACALVLGCTPTPDATPTIAPELEGDDTPEGVPASVLQIAEPALQEIDSPVPHLEFPQKGRLDDLDLLYAYVEVVDIDESDVDYAEKAKAWLRFSRKWSAEKAYASHAHRRAMQWLKANRVAETWDADLKKLLTQLDNGKISAEEQQQRVEEFLLAAPSWWIQRRGVGEELRAHIDVSVLPLLPSVASPADSVLPSTEGKPVVAGVIDFCGVEETQDLSHFVRKRVLSFPLSNAEIVEQGELDIDGSTVFHLKEAKGATIFEGMFRSYFPLKRFDTVFAEAGVPGDWFEIERLSLHDVNAVVQDDFGRYSVACADYVVIGKVDSFSGKWLERKMDDPKTGQELDAPALKANVKGEIVIFQRQGDGFERLSKFRANSAGLLGFASGFSSQLAQSGIDLTGTADRIDEIGVAEAMSYVSPRPVPGCSIPSPEAGVAALSCPADYTSLPELPGPPGMGESSKATCTDFEQIRDRRGAAVCGIRTAGELFAVSVQKEARGAEGWRLFAALETTEGVFPGIALGDNEGVTRGMGFHAVTGSGESKRRLAYAKVKKVGALQKNGEQGPSELSWRIGEAPAGTRMEEHPQIGFTVALGPLFLAPTLRNSDIVTGVDSSIRSAQAFMGPELEVGYDLTRYTLSEFWLRSRVSYVIAPVPEYRLSSVNIQVGPEVRLGVFRRGYWFGSLSGNISVVSLKSYVDRPEASSFGQVASGSDTIGGVDVRTGLDVMINADLYLRFSLGWLQNFGRLEYEKNDEFLFNRRDRLSGMTIALTIAYTL